MDCVGQPGVDPKFDADFKSGFSFSVRLISISARDVESFGLFWKCLRFFSVPPLNNFTQQDSLQDWVSTTENEPKSWLRMASQWLLLVAILKKLQNFGGLGGNGDQSDRKTKTRFEICVKFWIYPWLSNAIHWPRTLSSNITRDPVKFRKRMV